MSETERDFQTVVLAALLHDIGKFRQRTGADSGRAHPELSAYWVGEFLGNHWQDVEHAVEYHHLSEARSAKNQRVALTLVLADWCSSGERQELPEGETGRPQADALLSIFSQLRDGSREESGGESYFPLTALPDDGRLEPSPQIEVNQDNYTKLWNLFAEESLLLNRSDFPLLVSQLLSLLEKYTMFVPSATWKSKSDISLYHHLKSTAAIASCIYLSGLDAPAINATLERFESSDRCFCLLVGGDLSGIQTFIYNLRTKGALKSLRGRSLYLQLLSEAVAKMILDEFGLTYCNLLYCGGGHFYLLVPSTDDADSRITAIAQRVDKTLLAAHNGRLGVSIASTVLSAPDFEKNRFGAVWNLLHERLAYQKRRRFSSLLKDQKSIAAVLGPAPIEGEEVACTACGEETDQKDSEGSPLCPMCASFAELASDLKTATGFTLVSSSVADKQPETWQDVLAGFGCKFRLEDDARQTANSWLLNGTNFLRAGYSGFRFLATHVPTKNGSTAELQDIVKESSGIQRWGVLRMDVDGLGETFKKGLGDNRSISRLSMLSHLLGYFFSARVQAVAQEQDYRDKVYLAYSGGDDLFAIGAWSTLPKFAQRIREEFNRYTSGRLSISAGIFLAPSLKFPVYEAAYKAGDAESASKNEGRNRLTFLERTVPWDHLPELVDIKERLVGLLNDGLPRSILTILRSSWEEQRQADRGVIPMYPIWRLLYAFKRLKERHKELAERIDKLEHQIVANGQSSYLDLIIRWAEYETRRKDAKQTGTGTLDTTV